MPFRNAFCWAIPLPIGFLFALDVLGAYDTARSALTSNIFVRPLQSVFATESNYLLFDFVLTYYTFVFVALLSGLLAGLAGSSTWIDSVKRFWVGFALGAAVQGVNWLFHYRLTTWFMLLATVFGDVTTVPAVLFGIALTRRKKESPMQFSIRHLLLFVVLTSTIFACAVWASDTVILLLILIESCVAMLIAFPRRSDQLIARPCCQKSHPT